MNVKTDPPAWREFPSGLVPQVDGPIHCVKCERPAQLYVLDLREDMWFTCMDHHAAVTLDLLGGKLDEQRPPQHCESDVPAPSSEDVQDRVAAWQDVLAFRARAARLQGLTDQLRFAIYALDETFAPLREVIDNDAHLAAAGGREMRELSDHLETATRSARAVERIVADIVRALPPQPPLTHAGGRAAKH